jgi:hypothetical protein
MFAFHKKCGIAITEMVKSPWVYRRLRNFRRCWPTPTSASPKSHTVSVSPRRRSIDTSPPHAPRIFPTFENALELGGSKCHGEFLRTDLAAVAVDLP